MNPLFKIADWLDRREFLRFRLWGFSLRNSTRMFPWYFLCRVLLLHPVTALRGFFFYRKLVRESHGGLLNGTANLTEIQQLLLEGHHNPTRFLIAPGFCMKPYDEAARRSTCPAGHFNQRCIVLENTDMASRDQATWKKPCSECHIGTLAKLSVSMRADFYIMTSALDIARDLFLPAIRGDGAQTGVFLLCRYSTEPFTMGLAACRIKGHLVTFCSGACENHADFTNADKGLKEKQTSVEETTFRNLTEDLEEIARKKGNSSGYVRRGNIYSCREGDLATE